MTQPIPTYDLPGATGPVGPQRDGAYFGITVRETAGAVAVVKITSTGTGAIKSEVTLAAAGSIDLFYGPGGLKCSGGMTYTLISGTVEGSVRFA